MERQASKVLKWQKTGLNKSSEKESDSKSEPLIRRVSLTSNFSIKKPDITVESDSSEDDFGKSGGPIVQLEELDEQPIKRENNIRRSSTSKKKEPQFRRTSTEVRKKTSIKSPDTLQKIDERSESFDSE